MDESTRILAPEPGTWSVTNYNADGSRETYWVCPHCWYEWDDVTTEVLSVSSIFPTTIYCPNCNQPAPYTYAVWRSGCPTTRKKEAYTALGITESDNTAIPSPENPTGPEIGGEPVHNSESAGQSADSPRRPEILEERSEWDQMVERVTQDGSDAVRD